MLKFRSIIAAPLPMAKINHSTDSYIMSEWYLISFVEINTSEQVHKYQVWQCGTNCTCASDSIIHGYHEYEDI